MNTDQRSHLTDKLLRQFLFLEPTDLILQDKQVTWGELDQSLVNLLRRNGLVGPAKEQDAVRPARVHLDNGVPSGAIQPPDQRGIYPGPLQFIHHHTAIGGPDAARVPDLSAGLESKLLMVDDDMDMSSLPKTNYIKSIVTSERKGVQIYQSQLYVRFLCFSNGALTALHDRSDGFFRRQIVLTTKDKSAGRADDPFLSDKLIAEREGIFLWCLEGLRRLLVNNYRFTISDRAKKNISVVVREANIIVDFLSSASYVQFKAGSEAATRDLHAAYKVWCEDNTENPLSPKSFFGFVAQNADAYRLEATNNVYIGSGKRYRAMRELRS